MWDLKVLYLLVFASLYRRLEAAVFESCDHVFDLSPGMSYLESPYYPRSYPRNTSCRYRFKAPTNHGITVKCTINLDKKANSCSTEFFYLARDGDKLLRGSEQLCGYGSLIRKSLFNTFTIAYISGGSTGSFKCSLNVQAQPCDCGWSINTKIVNGKDANANEYPSLAALREKSSNMPLYCAAAIISQRFIVTAAHCAHFQPNPAFIEVLVGRQNIELAVDTQYADVYLVSDIKVHPHYTPDPTRNDIALMKTTKDIEFRRGVGPICLPPFSNMNNAFAYYEVDVAGWGATSFAGSTSATLQKISLLVSTEQTCKEAFEHHEPIFSSHICTYDYSGQSKDSCQYDSGGPVILKHLSRQFLVGVISFGKLCGLDANALSVNERVTAHLPWILANTEHTTCYVEM